MAFADKLKAILASLQGGVNNAMLGSPQPVNEAPSGMDLASAGIAPNEHPQGFAQNLAEFARRRGTARLGELGGRKQEQERQSGLALKEAQTAALGRQNQPVAANVQSREVQEGDKTFREYFRENDPGTVIFRTQSGDTSTKTPPKNTGLDAFLKQREEDPEFAAKYRGDENGYRRFQLEEAAGITNANRPAPVAGDRERRVADYMTHPELVSKYGAGETGFDNYVRAQEAANRPEGAEAGTYNLVFDDQGRVIGAWNPKSQKVEKVPEELAGSRKAGLPSGERTQLANIDVMLQDLGTLEKLADDNKGAIGPIEGRIAAAKRLTVGTSDEVNEMFRISDNLADQLLRARSGAQINEQEYGRLKTLVPNPRGPEGKFFSDLKGFRSELERVGALRKGAPAAPEAPATGNTGGAIEYERGPDGKLRPKVTNAPQ